MWIAQYVPQGNTVTTEHAFLANPGFTPTRGIRYARHAPQDLTAILPEPHSATSAQQDI